MKTSTLCVIIVNFIPSRLNFNHMAFPWAAAAAGGASIGGSIIGASATQKANHDARNFALMQGDIEYERELAKWRMQNQRSDELWNRQNLYDSPLAQMERLRAAGLNPNLIYGQMEKGTPADPASIGGGGRPGNWRPEVPNFDLSGGIMAYLNAQQQEAQTDNLKAQQAVLIEQAGKLAVEKAMVVASTAKTNQEREQASQLFPINLDHAKESLRRTGIEADQALHQDQRAQQLQPGQLAKISEEIAKIRQETESSTEAAKLMRLEQALKQYDLSLRGMGVQMNDNMLFRLLGRGINEIKKATPKSWKKFYRDTRDKIGNY